MVELMHHDRPIWPVKDFRSSSFKRSPFPSNQVSAGPELVAQRTHQSRAPLLSIFPGMTQRGTLDARDGFNPLRIKRFADTYRIKSVDVNQQVRAKVKSSTFDPFIELIDAQMDKVIFNNDDNGRNRNSQISFVVQPGVTYHLRVSSYARRETGDYELTLRALTPSLQDFSFAYGHGLVDAHAAVEEAIALSSMDMFNGVVGRSAPYNTALKSKPELSPETTTDVSWNLKRIKAPQVWQQGIRGKGIVVAVVDSGVSVHHPDINTNLWRNKGEIPNNGLDDDGNGFIDDVRGWDFIKSDNNPRDGEIHGTHVAGIVGAQENSVGITGVAPDATIMPVRVLDRNGSGTSKGVAQGIRYAVKNGADVINLSLGAPPGGKPSRSIRRALRFAHRKGVVVAIAAGNEHDSLGAFRPGEPAFWAATRNLAIVVGAVNRKGEVADFSNPTGNRKVNPFVVAPGVNVGSLAAVWLRNEFDADILEFIEPLTLSGTSMATPHVAGIAALMLSANPHLTPKQVNQILVDTANPENLTSI
ncbi:MAG: S8 family peptidase [Cyanobacteria bacterium P01_F01_bin.150]